MTTSTLWQGWGSINRQKVARYCGYLPAGIRPGVLLRHEQSSNANRVEKAAGNEYDDIGKSAGAASHLFTSGTRSSIMAEHAAALVAADAATSDASRAGEDGEEEDDEEENSPRPTPLLPVPFEDFASEGTCGGGREGEGSRTTS